MWTRDYGESEKRGNMMHKARKVRSYLGLSAALLGLGVLLTGCPAFVNQPPVAIADATPLAGEAPLTVAFDGSGSFDPDGTIVSYSWNFGDGSPAVTTQTPSHKFTTEGTFLVILTVTDNLGKQGSDTLFITVGKASIYFSSDRTGNMEIFRMDDDGANEAQVTNSPSSDEITPSLVPNTRDRLAYASDVDAPAPGFFDIFVSNPDGTLPSNLTPTQTASSEIQPSWSPDGARIAFTSDQTGDWEIFILPSNGGTAPTRLTSVEAGGFAVSPAISPDGTQIAFAADCNTIAVVGAQAALSDCGNDFEIFTMTINSGNQVTAVAKLTSNTDNDGSDPVFALVARGLSWSPDGTKIAFYSDANGNLDIFTINADGTGLTQVTTHSADDFDPFWLPGGEEIAFVSDRDGGVLKIFKLNVDTLAVTGPLTDLGGVNINPAGVDSSP
jgi:Tol biopolymer transport system component